MKAINTYWDGRLFRSRLEARWAVFFKEMGIAYEYEKEGYELRGGITYLPDFWLTDLKFWIEIKPGMPSDEEYRKAELLVASSGIPLYMAVKPIGNVRPWPAPGENWLKYDYGDDPPEHIAFFGEDGICYVDENYSWTKCPACGRMGIEFEGRAHRLCGCKAGQGKEGRGEQRCEELLTAYSRAITERFKGPCKTQRQFERQHLISLPA